MIIIKTITVNTSKSYDILLGDRLRESIPEIIRPFCPTKKVLMIPDDTVDALYGGDIKGDLCRAGFEVEKFVFKNGESSKNINVLSQILEFAAEKGFKRNDLFIALGGGVVGDMAGLAAALYMRGVSIIQVPTTLLSAVDSSVGGKTAIDLKAGKNLCGAFKQPRLVVIDTDIIKNLPEDVFLCGMGEVIKCGIIKELPVFEFIENDLVKDKIEQIITDCLLLKKEIVEEDEFDSKGIRNILNVGHTIGHSIELLSNYSIPHGTAVAKGLVMEARLSEKLGICPKDRADIIEKTVKKAGFDITVPYKKEEISKACLLDKKNKDSRIVFLLPEKSGKCREVALTLCELNKYL